MLRALMGKVDNIQGQMGHVSRDANSKKQSKEMLETKQNKK